MARRPEHSKRNGETSALALAVVIDSTSAAFVAGRWPNWRTLRLSAAIDELFATPDRGWFPRVGAGIAHVV